MMRWRCRGSESGKVLLDSKGALERQTRPYIRRQHPDTIGEPCTGRIAAKYHSANH